MTLQYSEDFVSVQLKCNSEWMKGKVQPQSDTVQSVSDEADQIVKS